MSENSNISASSVAAIIFDLGRVLVNVDFNRGFFPLLTQKQKSNHAEAVYNNTLFREFNTGKISIKQFYETLNGKYDLQLDFPTFKRQWCAVFSPIPGMEALLKLLSEKYVLGLLSDTDELHWEYCLHNFPFLKIFRQPTLSFKTGYLKPDARCFEIAAQDVRLPASRCLFIDDRPVNVQGAIDAGMKALPFNNVYSLRKELENRGII